MEDKNPYYDYGHATDVDWFYYDEPRTGRTDCFDLRMGIPYHLLYFRCENTERRNKRAALFMEQETCN